MKILFFGFGMLGHLLWVFWLTDVFPKWRPRRYLLLALAIVFSLTTPLLRASSLSLPIKTRLLALSSFELMVAVLCSIPLYVWIVLIRRVPSRWFESRHAASSGNGSPPPDTRAEAAESQPILSLVEGEAGSLGSKVVGPSAIDGAKNENDRDVAPQKTSTSHQVPPPTKLTRRDAIEKLGGLSLAGVSASGLLWGHVRGRFDFQLSEVVVKIKGLPRALDGYTIVQASDIHVGTFMGEETLTRGLSLVAPCKPDLVVLTGDLIDYDPAFLPTAARAFSSLRARDGVVAILGNHDYYAGATEVTQTLRNAGITMLVNQSKRMRQDDGGGFLLAGVDDFQGIRRGDGGPNFAKATAGLHRDLPTLLLAHQPHYFDEVAGQVALQISGHLHGGQINPVVKPAKLLLRYVEGRYEANGSTLYINRGFGTAGPPSRLFAPPEITKFVLISA